jgi:nucleoid DNA-binding protein
MKEKLNLNELVDALAEKSGISKKLAETIIKEFSDMISEGLETDGLVKVRGLGTFKLKRVAARVGRNLQTGESIEIPPHNKVSFTPENKLKEMVNEEFNLLTYKELPSSDAPEKPKPSTPPPPKPVTPPPPEKKPVFTPTPRATETPPPKPPPPPPPRPTPKPAETPKPASTQTFRPTPPPPPKKPGDKGEGPSKRKPYWIIPVALLIIAILIVIFYFRACTDDKPVEKEPVKKEIVKEPEPPVITDTVPEKVEKEPEPEVIPEKPKPQSTEYTMRPGDYLFQLARDFYGDPYFWVLIYKENAHQITHPEDATTGAKLMVPALEGDRFNLTRNDSMNLSEGYRMLYEFYTLQMSSEASKYHFGMNRYKPQN